MSIKKITFSALFLALCYVLPFLSGSIPVVGKMLCLMHIPVLLAGFLLGWKYGLLVGFLAPITRSLIFGFPTFYPDAIAMTLELATYGFVSGLLFKIFKLIRINEIFSIIISLLVAMIFGRIVWGISRAFLTLVGNSSFSLKLFISGGLLNAWPGILLQLILIPILVKALRKTHLFN